MADAISPVEAGLRAELQALAERFQDADLPFIGVYAPHQGAGEYPPEIDVAGIFSPRLPYWLAWGLTERAAADHGREEASDVS